MQKILIVIFAMAFFFKPVIPVLEYVVNYDYIVEQLCINRDIENSTCNGKCHLTSELADASESADSRIPDRKQHLKVEVLFLTATAEYPITGLCSNTKIVHSYRSDLYHYLGTGTIFHPPSLV